MKNIFKIFICFLLIFQPLAAISQDAALLPNGMQVFLDNNGKPLNGGKVYFYIPNTSTLKTTWIDPDQDVANSNPVILDSSGRAVIYGNGQYRQVLRDRNDNLIWDKLTASTGSGGSGGATGDGDLVGTIKPWAGLVAPNQYLFAYGQEIARATYPELYTAITLTTSAFCTTGSPILTGISDTTQIPIGGDVEASCIPSGSSTVLSKTGSTITLAANANISISLQVTIFPWGNGNGINTFNLPDLRGKVIAGRNNMGGIAASTLTLTYFGVNPDALGASGGNQSNTLVTANLPPYTPSGTVSAPVITTNERNIRSGPDTNVMAASNQSPTQTSTTTVTASAPTFTGSSQGGTSTPLSIVQPTVTSNYIIKVTPDTNSDQATGVLSIAGMTGAITCGSNLTCTGNVIDALNNPGIVSVGSTGQLAYYGADGTTVLGNANVTASFGTLTVGQSGSVIGQVLFSGNTSGTVTVTPQATAGTPTLTLPNASGTFAVSATSPLVLSATTGALTCSTCGVTGTGLQQFASTTSAQLAGVISDETGSGVLVFGTSPTLTTPVITTPAISGGTIDNTVIGNTTAVAGKFTTVITGVTTVSSLPTCNSGLTGARYFVTNGSGVSFNTNVSGGGSSGVPVFCDGTNWKYG